MSTFTDTFDYSGADLAENGWTIVNSDFTTDASRLTPDSGPLQNDIYRSQPRATGVFELNGVQNSARFYGLRIAFINQARSFRGSSNPVGYTIQFRQERRGEVFFNVRGGPDGSRRLMTLDRNHGGDPHDVRIERDPDTYEFTVYYDGERVGSVVDDTFTESSYMALRFDGGSRSQRIGRVGVNAFGSRPTLDIARVRPVQVVFETGLAGDGIDLVAGKQTAVLVYVAETEASNRLTDPVEVELSGPVVESTSRTVQPSDITSITKPASDRDEGSDYLAIRTRAADQAVTDDIEITVNPQQADIGESTAAAAARTWQTDGISLEQYNLRVKLIQEEGITVSEFLPAETFDSHVNRSTAFLRGTFPVVDDELTTTRSKANVEVSSVPLIFPFIGNVAAAFLLGDLEHKRKQSNPTPDFGIGVAGDDLFEFLNIGAGFTVWETNNRTAIVQANYHTATAHELGHQFGLYRNQEEYDNFDDRATGYWVDQNEYVGEFDNARAFMGLGTRTDRFEDLSSEYWIDNHPDEWESTGLFIPNQSDQADYDVIFRRLLQSPETDGGGVRTAAVAQQPTATDPGSSVYIKGLITKSDDFLSRRWYYYDDLSPSPTSDGEYSFVIMDGNGNTLREKSFTASFRLLTGASGVINRDIAGISFAAAYPEGAQMAEIRRDGTVLAQFDLTVKLLRDGIASIPADAFVLTDADETVADRRATLEETVTEIGDQLDAGNTRQAAQILQDDLRPSLAESLKPAYEANTPFELTRSRLFELTDELLDRLSDEVTTVDEYGAIYDASALSEQGSVVARVTAQDDTGPDAKAGVMVRNDIEGSGDARGYVICAVTPDSGFSMEWDSDGTGYLDTTRRAGETTYPCWLRLRKDGTTFVGSYSTDGEEWTEIASTTLPEAAATQDAGVFATSGTLDATSEVEFEAFSVDPRS